MGHKNLKSIKIVPNKQFGQHFLIQQSAIQNVTNIALSVEAMQLLEIGPGEGVLTNLLLMDGRPLWAIDLDLRSINVISQRFAECPHLHPIHGDVLLVPLELDGPLSVVGNLPYNAATAILTRFLLQPIPWAQMVFMFQLEVGKKLVGKPNDKEYGPLSVLTQLVCDISKVMTLGPQAFRPAPKVDSIVMLFKAKEHSLPLSQRSLFLTFLRISFRHRRKTLANNWCGIFSIDYIHEIFKIIGLPTNVRAENLSPEVWLTIFNMTFSYLSFLSE